MSTGTEEHEVEMEKVRAWAASLPVDFTEQQLAALSSVRGPVLLLAVPGSGKTTVLVSRLGYMIQCCGIAPERILTVTYTVAAARDMSARFAAFFGQELADHVEFRTINGICAKIIAYYGKLLGKEPFSLLTDEKKSGQILSAIYQKAVGDYPTDNDLKMIRTAVAYIKNSMLDGNALEDYSKKHDFPLAQIYTDYTKTLREMRLMDYDDQMVYAYNILKGNREVLEFYQKRYPYICVDEAQDTSKIQHTIIALLASGQDNLFMVGDEDQSIYGFRAAYPKALLEFEQNHPGAKVLLMEENFRSNANIVVAADRFIQANTLRHQKNMNAARDAAEKIRKIEVKGRRAQYRYLAKVAEDCDRETAVLYRDNECAVPLVDLLVRNGTPFRIRNAELGFFSHRSVVDIEDILRFALEPTNSELFLKFYYKIGAYLRKEDALRIAESATAQGIPVLDRAVSDVGIPIRTAKRLREIRKTVAQLRTDNGAGAIDRILKELNYGEYLERTGIGNGRIFILKTVAENEPSAGALLERMKALEQIFREKVSDPDCPFILSTIHSSKGLEYDTVYILDALDGIFPEKVLKNPKNADRGELETYEEERRLFYVGVTRAKNRLNLFSRENMSTFTEQLLNVGISAPEKDRGVSSGRFAAADLSITEPGERRTPPAQELAEQRERRLAVEAEARRAVSRYTQSYAASNRDDEDYRKFSDAIGYGSAVRHVRYGDGSVTMILGTRVTIRFLDGAERAFDMRVLSANGQLTIL